MSSTIIDHQKEPSQSRRPTVNVAFLRDRVYTIYANIRRVAHCSHQNNHRNKVYLDQSGRLKLGCLAQAMMVSPKDKDKDASSPSASANDVDHTNDTNGTNELEPDVNLQGEVREGGCLVRGTQLTVTACNIHPLILARQTSIKFRVWFGGLLDDPRFVDARFLPRCCRPCSLGNYDYHAQTGRAKVGSSTRQARQAEGQGQRQSYRQTREARARHSFEEGTCTVQYRRSARYGCVLDIDMV